MIEIEILKADIPDPDQTDQLWEIALRIIRDPTQNLSRLREIFDQTDCDLIKCSDCPLDGELCDRLIHRDRVSLYLWKSNLIIPEDIEGI